MRRAVPRAYMWMFTVDGSNTSPAQGGWQKDTNACRAFWRGATETPFLPSFILLGTFLGFGALARTAGLGLSDVLFMSVFVFALPAQVVLVDQIGHGAALVTVTLAVTATGVRLLPMVVSFVPLIRDEKVPRWMEYAVAYFIAVTMWVEGMRRAPGVPRHLRAIYVLGIALNLVTFATCGGAAGYLMATGTPESITAALLFMSPIYFIVAMLAGTRDLEGMIPIVIGVVLGPVLHLLVPELDLLLTGLIGGSLSYFLSPRLFASRDTACSKTGTATRSGGSV